MPVCADMFVEKHMSYDTRSKYMVDFINSTPEAATYIAALICRAPMRPIYTHDTKICIVDSTPPKDSEIVYIGKTIFALFIL